MSDYTITEAQFRKRYASQFLRARLLKAKSVHASKKLRVDFYAQRIFQGSIGFSLPDRSTPDSLQFKACSIRSLHIGDRVRSLEEVIKAFNL